MDTHVANTLKELQAQLRQTEALTESDRQFVEELHEEIEELLARSARGLTIEHHPLLGRLDDAAQRFEVSHPDLTGVIGRVVDSLSTMGI